MQLLGGQGWKSRLEIKPQLVSEDPDRPGAGAVLPFAAMGQDVVEEIKVGLHGLHPLSEIRGAAMAPPPFPFSPLLECGRTEAE